MEVRDVRGRGTGKQEAGASSSLGRGRTGTRESISARNYFYYIKTKYYWFGVQHMWGLYLNRRYKPINLIS